MPRSRWWPLLTLAVVIVPPVSIVVWKTVGAASRSTSIPRDSQPSLIDSVGTRSSVASNGPKSRIDGVDGVGESTQMAAVRPRASASERLSSTEGVSEKKAESQKKPVKKDWSPKLEARIAAAARELGTREVKVENPNTLYFEHGAYIPGPYTIRREGFGLYVNGKVSWHIPAIPESYVEEFPGPPPGLTRKTSWKQIDQHHETKKFWPYRYEYWFFSHYPPAEAEKRFVEFLRALPFVKTLSWIPAMNGKRYLRVESHAGDTREFFTSWWDPKQKGQDFSSVFGIPQKDRIRPLGVDRLQETRAALERGMKFIEAVASSGDVVIFGPDAHIRLRHPFPMWKNIVQVVEILKSNASAKVKAYAIYPRIVDRSQRADPWDARPATGGWRTVKELVHHFRGHPQLDQRIAALKKKYNIPDWKQPPEPPPTKIPDKLKNDPRLTPQGTIREALRLLQAKKYQEYYDRCCLPSKYGKRSIPDISKKGYFEQMIDAYRNMQNTKPQIDDIDDTGYFHADDSKLKNKENAFKKTPIRKVGPLWLIGY